MATSAEFFIRKLTIELDELANKWNKTRDPGIRDQWYKKLKQVPPKAFFGIQENLGYNSHSLICSEVKIPSANNKS
jgi:hypothetical protein